MKITIENAPVYSSLRIEMEKGEKFRAEPGAMISMTPSIEVQAKSAGKGIMGTLKAAVGGESIFASIYTAEHGSGELFLAPSLPGDIARVDLDNETLLAFRGAYLAGDTGIALSSRGSLKGLIAGADLFLSVLTGTGSVFVSSFGAIYTRTLGPGEPYVVDTGHIVAFNDGMQYSIKTASKGLFSSFASGEGLVCLFVGPGTIWMQTRNVRSLAEMLIPFLPKG